MWSDAPDPARTRRLARRLTAAAGPIGTGRRRERLDLSAVPESLIVGLGLERQSGTVWLDGGRRRRHHLAWAPRLSVATRDGHSHIRAGDVDARLDGGGFESLAALVEAFDSGGGRLFGYLAYELGGELESLPPPLPRDVDVPDLWLCLHDFWLEHDHEGWTLVTCGDWEPERLDSLRQRLRAADATAAGEAAPAAGTVSVEPDGPAYVAAVRRTIRRIHDGEIFQTNLCRRFEAACEPAGAWPLYRAMRVTGDAAYGAWVVADTGAVLSRSPECFLRSRGGEVESRPIKGTRRRGRDPTEDRALRRELETSVKDRAELAMIVDLVRNDLGRVCVAGSVSVAEHARLLELPGVWHTVSCVRGRLRADVGPDRLLRAAFPAGSITGAPKIQAMVVAAAEEPRRRGPAMGSVGWIDPAGDLELSVAIRTAVAAAGRVVYHAGCGIVADSDPEHEEQESLVKARPFLAALDR